MTKARVEEADRALAQARGQARQAEEELAAVAAEISRADPGDAEAIDVVTRRRASAQTKLDATQALVGRCRDALREARAGLREQEVLAAKATMARLDESACELVAAIKADVDAAAQGLADRVLALRDLAERIRTVGVTTGVSQPQLSEVTSLIHGQAALPAEPKFKLVELLEASLRTAYRERKLP